MLNTLHVACSHLWFLVWYLKDTWNSVDKLNIVRWWELIVVSISERITFINRVIFTVRLFCICIKLWQWHFMQSLFQRHIRLGLKWAPWAMSREYEAPQRKSSRIIYCTILPVERNNKEQRTIWKISKTK